MVQGKWFPPGEDLSALLPIRESVFGRGADDLDAASWNVLVYQDSVPVATGRIWWQDGAFRLGDLGVLEGFRRQRLGDLVLRLECPRDVTGFFSRLGLKEESSSGDAVEMMIPGDLIDLDTCKNCPKASCPNRHD